MSNYSMMYQHMAEVFPKENILIVNGETLIEDPLQEIKNVEKFLRIPSFFSKDHFVYPEEKAGFPCFKLGDEAEADCMGKGKGRTHPPLDEETKDFLRKRFRPMLDVFKKQTGIVLELENKLK